MRVSMSISFLVGGRDRLERVGAMDNRFANLAVYRMESLLMKLSARATFTYRSRQGHMCNPMSDSELVRSMVNTMNGTPGR
jgi:hypothetical protein